MSTSKAGSGLGMLRLVLWLLVILAGVGATVWSLLPREQGFGQVAFRLTDHNGAPISEAAFRGQPSGLFFGFTRCPEVCPTTLSEIAVWLDDLGVEGKDLKFFFVSVDPERDDPETLKGFVTLFSDQITGMTGDPAEIEKLKKAWGIYAERVPTSNGDYTMDHTATLFLLDSKGHFDSTIAYQENTGTAEQKLRKLLKQN